LTERLQVTYVVGSSHSGSTLIAFLADQHPQIASVGETAVKRRIRREGRASAQQCSCGERLDSCPFWQAIFADASAAGVPLSTTRWRTDYRFEHPWLDAVLTRETSWFAWRQGRRWATRHLPPFRTRTARVDSANVAFVRAVLTHQHAQVFFDTTKLLTRLTYLLDIPDLEVRVVRLVRDVRGFAASAQRRGESIETATSVWMKDQAAIDRVLAQRPHVRRTLVRYEDLCREPHETLQRLWEFCGVAPMEPSTTVRAREHHVLGNSMRMGDTITVRLDETWRSQLAPADEQRVLAIAGPLNERLGYARA
jgi:hypothetical protein